MQLHNGCHTSTIFKRAVGPKYLNSALRDAASARNVANNSSYKEPFITHDYDCKLVLKLGETHCFLESEWLKTYYEVVRTCDVPSVTVIH